jgi:hypothetical protein
MFEREIPCCEGAGSLPDVILVGGVPVLDYTLPAATAANLSWSLPQQKLFAQNNSGADVRVLIGDEDCSSSSAAIVLADGQPLTIGKDRPHEFTKISLYSSAQLILSGAGQNFTILGWPRGK